MKSLNPLAPFEWAKKELGISEIAGDEHNPRIIWYHAFTNLKLTEDEISWCSAFICAAAEINGYPSTRSPVARSWKTYGEEGDGSVGDIVVFSRPGNSWSGHVGFVARKYKIGDKVVISLGGNQSNKVCIQGYDASRIVAFRRFPPRIE